MAKKVTRIAKLQFKAGQAKPGPELAGLGINMAGFTKDFNDATRDRMGDVVPVVITAYDDKSYDFELKTSPAASMILKKINLEKGSSIQKDKVGSITWDQLKEIAEYKLVDLNTNDIEQGAKQIAGTAINMGITVVGMPGQKVEESNDSEDVEAE